MNRAIETIQTSLGALWQNKLRTFLTMLGVIIGVFSVVSLVSLVQGVRNYVTDQFEELGSNLLFVYPGSAGWQTDPALSFSNNKLAKKHIDLIEKYAGDNVLYVSPLIMVGRTVDYKTRSFFGAITGGDSNYNKMFNVELTKGEFFTSVDERSKAKVIVIGDQVVKELFKGTSAINKKVRIDNNTFKVIGIMEEKGPDYDEQIIMPYTVVEDILGVKQYSTISLKLKEGANADLVAKEVEIALLRDLNSDDFTTYTEADILGAVDDILGILTISLGAVAAISLVVGGIGIMNIMLVSVTERIQEIGLRKAVGATPLDIGFQFMVESIVISVLGGFLGLASGLGSTLIAQRWLQAEVPWWAVVLALGFSLLVGIGFGTYPAAKASKLDPIVALRYE